MNAVPLLAAAAFLALAGCGYVGPVVPPSAQIPLAVTDLSVNERGDQLIIQFTTAAHTTDGAAVRKYSSIDLRIGVAPEPFDTEAWAKNARTVEVTPPPSEGKREEARPIAITKSVPVKEWAGKQIAVLVRTSSRGEDHYSAWSNLIELKAIAPLAPPESRLEATAAGYKLTWLQPEAGAEYRIFRQGPNDKTPVELETTKQSSYTDGSAQWDTPYTYSVVAVKGGAESLPWISKPISVPDTFPPSVPTDVTAFPSSDAMEVAWKRSPEADLAGYFVYRSANEGPLEKQNGMVNVPSYSDHKVEHGKTYRYAISAIDAKGNEGEKSSPIEVAFP
ncbi:MAG TPA: hypothetical protein VH351_02310 [Bryobacteraceae bacterium]|nr:hypothetical protein [Bryobacteraceae bacterium]